MWLCLRVVVWWCVGCDLCGYSAGLALAYRMWALFLCVVTCVGFGLSLCRPRASPRSCVWNEIYTPYSHSCSHTVQRTARSTSAVQYDNTGIQYLDCTLNSATVHCGAVCLVQSGHSTVTLATLLISDLDRRAARGILVQDGGAPGAGGGGAGLRSTSFTSVLIAATASMSEPSALAPSVAVPCKRNCDC